MSKTAVSRGISAIARRAGVKVTLHQFRHTCASQLLANGVRLPHVQKLLGHKSIGTTMRYLHITVFDYTPTHARDGPAAFLKDYRGYLQADAFSGYDGI